MKLVIILWNWDAILAFNRTKCYFWLNICHKKLKQSHLPCSFLFTSLSWPWKWKLILFLLIVFWQQTNIFYKKCCLEKPSKVCVLAAFYFLILGISNSQKFKSFCVIKRTWSLFLRNAKRVKHLQNKDIDIYIWVLLTILLLTKQIL